MANIWTIAKRELASYFTSPIAYVVIVVFLGLAAFFTFFVSSFFMAGQATLEPFFTWHPWLYMFIVPAVGMRIWSEERRQGTLELLFTLPTTPMQGIIGKYLAGMLFLTVALALTFPMVITVNYLGTPDQGVITCGYIGSLMVAFTFLAISSLTSALNSNQVVSFIIALVICLILILAGFRPVTDFMSLWASQNVVEFTASLSVITHYDAIQRGVLDIRDFIYYATVIAFCLFSTSVVLHSRRAS